MALVATTLVMTDLTTKWGLVTVLNADMTVLRRFRITAAMCERVHQRLGLSGDSRLAQAWASGRVCVESRPCLAGQCVQNPDDGTLMVNTGLVEGATTVDVTLTAVPRALWDYVGGVVLLDRTVVRALGL